MQQPATETYIGLGSNLQDPAAQLRDGLRAISALPHSRLCRISRVYRSSPMGPTDQPHYLNAVARLATCLMPLDLLDALQQIERQQGRVRDEHWGPRTLDLDVLLYGDLELDHPRLQLPHPGLTQRNFVLYPLAEVADPKMRLPGDTDLDTLLTGCQRGDLEMTDLALGDGEPGRGEQSNDAR